MQTDIKSGMLAAALALALGGMASAQEGGPPPPGRGGPDGGGVMIGKVKSVDTGANTITISTRRGETCTVHVADGATIQAEKTVSVADLKDGDQIEVHGMPTGINASNIMDGDVRDALPPPPGEGEGPDQDGPQGGEPGRRPGPPAMANASGTITSTDPLTIKLGDDVSVIVKVASTAKVHKMVTEGLSDIKAGDRIVASGEPGDDGNLDVDKIAINVRVPAPRGRGPRGFGGPQMGGNGPGPDDMGPGRYGPGPQFRGGPDGGGYGPGPQYGRGPGGPDGGGGFGPGPGGPGPDGPDGGAPPPDPQG